MIIALHYTFKITNFPSKIHIERTCDGALKVTSTESATYNVAKTHRMGFILPAKTTAKKQ